MKKSFSIFLLVLIILITFILLRLQSISFPRAISETTRIIYLEEFHDFGHLFKIFYQDHGFKLKPYIRNLRLNRERVNTPVEIHNHDILRVQDHGFLVKISPETHVYKEIFWRPISEVLPSAYTVKYIGGWTSGEKRDRMVSKTDMKLLRDLIIEISPDLLSRVIPSTIAFDGKLIALKRQNQSVQLICPHLDISRIRKLQSQVVQKNHQIDIKSDDIIRIKSLDDGDDLVIKFNFKRVKSRIFRGPPGKERLVSSDITYMIISYLEKRRSPSDQTPVMVYLKSLDGQAVYRVSKNKETLFIGEKGLFLFDLMPDKLLDRQFIPDRIYEGGMMDIKELLDRRMVYRKNKNVYPVDLFFLKKLNNVSRDGLKKVEDYLKQNNIEWKSFIDETDFRNHVLKSEKIIQKMKRKKSWGRFCREIEKLNDPYFLKGVGISINKNIDYTVFYRTGNMSWIPAENWTMDIPEVVGINAFYWGNLIKKSDGVEFKFQFKQRPSPFKFISVGDYAYSLDGKTYNKRNFFDGVQTVERMGRNRILFLKVSNLNRFNQDISEVRLQVKINIQNSERQKRLLNSDESWESSIDLVNWNPVKIIPVKHYYGEKLEGALSIWYDEQWNPIFRGIKNRYFKKEFTLRFNPNQVSWTVRTPGEYLIWVNDRIIYAENDFLKSIGIGKNTLIVLVSKNGYLKKIPGSNLFVERENNIFLKQKQIRRTDFSKKNSHMRPDVVDVNRKKLVFDSEINGQHHRFFSSSAMGELESIIGSGKSGSWGLEQVFSEVYEESQVEEIQLTINQDWHKIVVRNLKKKLHKNKDKEDMNPGYRNLKEQLKQAEKQLSRLRIGLIRRDNTRIQRIMENIIRLQTRIDKLKTEINRIKNHFYEASMVLMNPRGQILAAAFYPYDEKTMKELNGEIQKPYRAYEVPGLNRAWKWNYNPGSTAKILDSISFLYSYNLKNRVTGRFEFPFLRRLMDPSNNFSTFPGNDLKGCRMLNGKQVFFQLKNFRGHNIPPGFCSLTRAFAHSYNTYFAYMALHNNRMLTEDSSRYKKNSFFISKANIPIQQTYQDYPVLKFAEQLFFNQKIDLLTNLKHTDMAMKLRRMPYDSFMAIESRFPVNAYTPSDIAYYAIGQSDLQLSTLQNALVASSILNKGVLYYPAIVKSIKMKNPSDRSEKVIEPDPEQFKLTVFDSRIAVSIKKSMKTVVDSGTAKGIFSPELKKGRRFYAKTGTAETKFYKDHSLFVGFVSFRDGSQLIFSTIVPRSGTGAAVAGRLTAQVIKDIIDFEPKKQL